MFRCSDSVCVPRWSQRPYKRSKETVRPTEKYRQEDNMEATQRKAAAVCCSRSSQSAAEGSQDAHTVSWWFVEGGHEGGVLKTWNSINPNPLLLLPWLFPSYRVACMTGDLPKYFMSPSLSPRPFSVECFSSIVAAHLSHLVFGRRLIFSLCYIRPQYVFFISPHHMLIPVQSSIRDVFGSLRHSRCPYMCSFLILSLHLTLHIHYSILILFTLICFLLSLRCPIVHRWL